MLYNAFSWIAFVLASIVYIFIVYSYFSSIFKPKYGFKVILGACVALALISLLFVFANNVFVNFAVSIITLVLITQLFTGGMRNRLLFALFILIAGFASEFIVAYATVTFANIRPYYIHFGTPEFVYGLMLSRTLFAIFARIISGVARKRKLPKLKLIHWIALTVPPAGSFIVLYNFMFLRSQSIADMISSMIVMVTSIIVITVYGKILSDHEVELKNNYLEELLGYHRYQYYLAEKSEKAVSKTKHDIKNLLIGFRADIQNQNVKNVQDGINKLLGEIDKFDGPAASGNLFVDSIINYKASVASGSNILFSVELNLTNGLDLNSVIICQILGNAMDNAIEATEKIEDISKRIIQISMSYKQGALLIQISNPYNDAIIENSEGNLMSSKRHFRTEGIGLQSIKSIVVENDGLFDVNYANNEFCLSVILYNVIEN